MTLALYHKFKARGPDGISIYIYHLHLIANTDNVMYVSCQIFILLRVKNNKILKSLDPK